MEDEDEDIGTAGETILDVLLRQGNFVVNDSRSQDRKGWDRIVETVLPSNPLVPFDRRAADLRCFIQVKTTRSTSRNSWAISLRHMERAVKSPSPFFFALVHVTEALDLVALRILHVDEALIERTLRRLRESAASGHSEDDIREQKMLISWPEETLISPLTAASLRTRMVEIIGDPDTYTERKISFSKSIGYDGARIVGTISFAEGVTESDFLDVAVGRRPSLLLSKISVSDPRFGISFPIIEHEGEIVMSMTSAPLATVSVLAESPDGSSSAELQVAAYRATSPLNDDRWRINMTNGTFSFHLDSSQEDQMGFNVEFRKAPQGVADLGLNAEFLEVIRTSSEQARGVVRFRRPLTDGSGDMLVLAAPILRIDDELGSAAEAWKLAWRCLRDMNAVSLDALVHPEELAGVSPQIRALRAALDNGHIPSGRVSLDSPVEVGQKLCVLVEVPLPLVDQMLVSVIALTGDVTEVLSAKEYLLSGHLSLVRWSLVPRTSTMLEHLASFREEVLSALENDHDDGVLQVVTFPALPHGSAGG